MSEVKLVFTEAKKIKGLFAAHALSFLLALFFLAGCEKDGVEPLALNSRQVTSVEPITGVVVGWDQVNSESMQDWQNRGYAVALLLTNDANAGAEKKAAESIKAAGLSLDYFIEVGRCPELAATHPEWMVSLQGHEEWRRFFPNFPQPTDQQVVKNEPWVPVLYRESFDAHLERIKRLLADKPPPARIWLNDLQGGPSACGCGHPLCRWTADYGPIVTATSLGFDAAAKFVDEVKSISPSSNVVPIFVGECEAEDKDSVCCGVDCFKGKCWKDFTLQLDALADQSDTIGVACFYRAFERDLDRYGEEGAWVSFAVNSFYDLPRKRGGTGVKPNRLVAMLQGWDVSQEQINAQVVQAKKANAAGWMISLTPIDQSWRPVIFDLPSGVRNDGATPMGHDHLP